MPNTPPDLTFAAVPLTTTSRGEHAYTRGRELVRAGVRLDQVVWDCDELLWDWVMYGPQVLGGFFEAVRGRFGHREHVRLKPGIFELLWGMHHESLAQGLDPHMRIATNGYPWRLHRFAQEIPGLATLVGAPACAQRYVGWRRHPRIFTRWEYAQVAELDQWHRARGTPIWDAAHVEAHFERRPFNSSYKLPELPAMLGKDGFQRARILVDDHASNIRRFAASGRVGVHVEVPGTPRKGRLPNTTFGAPRAHLDAVTTDLVDALADALLEAVDAPDASVVSCQGVAAREDTVAWRFEVDIPWDRIGGEWLEPMWRLKRQYKFKKGRRGQ